jgi:pectin methylesterase-like acyl-CoA thioesterase
MNIISLVSGDTLANLQISLVRKKGTTAILTTLTYDTNNSTLGTGNLQFALGPWVATVEEGYYEGEIEIVFDNGTRQTVFEHVTFRVRTQFS